MRAQQHAVEDGGAEGPRRRPGQRLEGVVHPGAAAAVAAVLAGDPQAAGIDLITGRADLLVTAAGLDPGRLGRCVLERIGTVPGVLRTRTALVERTLREGSRWSDGAPDAGRRVAIAAGLRPPADRPAGRGPLEDVELAKALGADGRMTYARLAQRTGVPVSTVRRRLTELRAAGRLVLRCDASPRLTGPLLGTMLRLNAPADRLPDAARWLSGRPRTRMCALTAGDANPAAYLVTRRVEEARLLEAEFTGRFPGVRVTGRQVTLRTVKLVGRLPDGEGRAVGYVPIDPRIPWRPAGGGGAPDSTAQQPADGQRGQQGGSVAEDAVVELRLR